MPGAPLRGRSCAAFDSVLALKHLECRRRAGAQHRDIAHHREEAHAALFEHCRPLGGVAKRARHFAGLLTGGNDAIELPLHIFR